MENNSLFPDDLLWEYADGLLDAAAYQRVTDQLRRQPDAQSRLDAILAEKKAFASVPLEAPPAGFADRVLAAWTLEQMQLRSAPEKGRDWMILLITGGFGLLLLVPVLALIITAIRSGASAMPFNYQLPTVNLSGVLGNTSLHYGIGLAFVFISLRLLDSYLHQAKSLRVV
ncbi:MAG: hypothetical protein ABIO24_13375 [Saprospiraceae bacterium]